MGFKSIALGASVLTLSTSVNAAIISADWQSAGDNLITQDTASGLEWLDITVTYGMSFNDVSAQFGTGGTYEGWRYATRTEIAGLWDAFGGDGIYTGYSTANDGLFNTMASYVGGRCEVQVCSSGYESTAWLTADLYPGESNYRWTVLSGNLGSDTDYFNLTWNAHYDHESVGAGSALVRDFSPVPVPAAVWLFGSGLLGLIGIARRKKA